MFQRVLVASDLTRQSANALAIARELGAAFGGQLIVAHVVEMPAALRKDAARDDLSAYRLIMKRQTRAAEKELDRQVTTAGIASRRGVRLVVRAGAPASVLAKLAEEIDADLIVVARGRGGTLGAVAERLVRLVGRAVVVAPVPGKQRAMLDVPGMRRPTARRRAAA